MWTRPPLLLLALSCALAACAKREPAPDPQAQLDPAIVAALADPIMIDPDLASQNRGNAAIALDTFDAVPLENRSPEAIEAAKAEAARLAGGMIRTAPEPSGNGADPEPPLASACAGGLHSGYGWAAMPQALPIYPRGHVREAAGSDLCALRTVTFVTPVEPSAVIDFYFTRAGDGGYSAERRRLGDADVLSGTKGRAAFVVRVRRDASGLSEVDLAVRG